MVSGNGVSYMYVIRSGFAIFERQIHSNYNMACVTIFLLRNDRESDLKQIENAFKDPEEKNSSEGIVGNSEVY